MVISLCMRLLAVQLVYPWADVPQDAVICDVGGSSGHIMLDLVRVHPHLQVVVQDLPNVQPMWDEVSFYTL